MKGELTYKVLEIIEKAAFATADVLEALFASPRQVGRWMHGNYRRPHRESIVEKLKEEQRFYNLLNYLQKQKLVRKERINDGTLWKITRKGEEKLQQLKNRLLKRPPKKNYPIRKATFITIVSFDIPEFNRKQRDWLRGALKRLGYKMVQKSVWIGKSELPIEFIEDLKKYRILPYVHIFTIGKKGTIANFKI